MFVWEIISTHLCLIVDAYFWFISFVFLVDYSSFCKHTTQHTQINNVEIDLFHLLISLLSSLSVLHFEKLNTVYIIQVCVIIYLFLLYRKNKMKLENFFEDQAIVSSLLHDAFRIQIDV